MDVFVVVAVDPFVDFDDDVREGVAGEVDLLVIWDLTDVAVWTRGCSRRWGSLFFGPGTGFLLCWIGSVTRDDGDGNEDGNGNGAGRGYEVF